MSRKFFELLPHRAPRTAEQRANIYFRQSRSAPYLLAFEPFKVAHRDDLSLPGRQPADERAHECGGIAAFYLGVGLPVIGHDQAVQRLIRLVERFTSPAVEKDIAQRGQ